MTISAFSREQIEQRLNPRVPIEVVRHHPVMSCREWTSEPDRTGLLAVGALRRYKGLDTVAAALKAVPRSERPHITWVGAPEFTQREITRTVVEHGVTEYLSIIGWLPDQELAALRDRVWGTVNPSRFEGYGLAVAESIAAGLPTLASDIPPHREIAGEAAAYFRPGDAEALASLLRRVRNDAGFGADLARRARRRAEQLRDARHTWGDAVLNRLRSLGVEQPA